MSKAQQPLEQLQSQLIRGDRGEIERFASNDLYPLIDPLSAKFSELIEVQLARPSASTCWVRRPTPGACA